MKSNAHRLITVEDIEVWKRSEPVALHPALRADYERKVSAITQYGHGAPLVNIRETTGVSRQYLYYMISRCQVPDELGHPLGFTALIKWKQVPKKPRRSAPEKLTAGRPLPGALRGLFLRYPELKKQIYDVIVFHRLPDSRKSKSRLTWAIIHDVFQEKCEELGIRAPNYPFCSDSSGFSALRKWGRKVRAEHERQKALDDAVDNQAYRINYGLALPTRCYERVECDGHFIDINWVVEAEGLTGEGIVRIKVSRLWLIALIETKSTAVLGYTISLGPNYSASDVARAVRSSLVPWRARKLSVSTIAYKPGECLPNSLDPALSYVCYDELWLDNAKSHLSDLFLSVLERTVNAVPVFGPRKSPNVRPHIEMLFDLIEEAGIHPLEGTTGSNPKDARRDDRHVLSLNLVLDLVDLLVVRYNAGVAPGTSISRLEVLRRAVYRETGVFRRIPKMQRDTCLKYDLYEVATIGLERDRPILRWRDARYFGSGLLSRRGLVGQQVLVMANSMDLRLIEVVLISDGTPLGVLEVERRWSLTPHSIWTRRQVRKEMTNAGFLAFAADIPRALRAHVEREGKSKKKQKRKLAQLVVEQQNNGAPENPQPDRAVASRDTTLPNTSPVVTDPFVVANGDDDEINEILRRLGTVYR